MGWGWSHEASMEGQRMKIQGLIEVDIICLKSSTFYSELWETCRLLPRTSQLKCKKLVWLSRIPPYIWQKGSDFYHCHWCCFVLFCFVFLCFVLNQYRISLCSPCYPSFHYVDQTGLELWDSPVSTSYVMELKMWTIMPSHDKGQS